MKHNFYAGKIVDGWLHFSDIRSNGLYKMNLMSGEVIFVALFEGCNIQDSKIHRAAVLARKYILFIPQHGKHFHCYDIKKGKTFLLKCSSEMEERFSDAVLVEDKIYLIPMHSSGHILYIDVNNLTIKMDERFEAFYRGLKNKRIITKRVVKKENGLWFGMYGTDRIVEFNLGDGTWKEYRCSVPDISGVFYSSQGLWVTSKTDKNLSFWNNEKTTKYLCEDSDDDINAIMSYAQVIEFNDSVYAVKNSRSPLYKLEDDRFVNIPLPSEYTREEGWAVDFFGYEQYEEAIYLFPVSGNALVAIRGNEVIAIPFADKYENEYGKRIKERMQHTSEILSESAHMDLSRFIEIIKQ